MELRSLHHARGLIAHSAQEQRTAAAAQRVGQAFDRLQSSRVYGGHVAKSQDDDPGKMIHVLLQVEQLVAAAKQEWSVNAINRDIVWNVVQLQTVAAAMLHV